MSTTTVRFVERLAEMFAALGPMLAEHMEHNFGEILPHVFMADVARWAITLSKNLAGEPRSQLMRLLALLEEAYAKEGPEIEELISVSFLEHLPRPDEAGWQIRDLVGPKLRKQLKVIG